MPPALAESREAAVSGSPRLKPLLSPGCLGCPPADLLPLLCMLPLPTALLWEWFFI